MLLEFPVSPQGKDVFTLAFTVGELTDLRGKTGRFAIKDRS